MPPPLRDLHTPPPPSLLQSNAPAGDLPLQQHAAPQRQRHRPGLEAAGASGVVRPTAAGAALPASADAPSAQRGSSSAHPLALHHPHHHRWLESCINRTDPLASLGSSEYWRARRSYLFYRHLYCVTRRYGASAASALDVGSALPPFLSTLGWLRERTIVGPRFAGNVAKGGGDLYSLPRIQTKYNVTAVSADFLAWKPPGARVDRAGQWHGLPRFDLVLCSEVVEHIADPPRFVGKLLQMGARVVLAVPYKWKPCKECHHVQNEITRERIAEWAGRQPDAYDLVREPDQPGKPGRERIICVFLAEGGAPARARAQPGGALLAGGRST